MPSTGYKYITSASGGSWTNVANAEGAADAAFAAYSLANGVRSTALTGSVDPGVNVAQNTNVVGIRVQVTHQATGSGVVLERITVSAAQTPLGDWLLITEDGVPTSALTAETYGTTSELGRMPSKYALTQMILSGSVTVALVYRNDSGGPTYTARVDSVGVSFTYETATDYVLHGGNRVFPEAAPPMRVEWSLGRAPRASMSFHAATGTFSADDTLDVYIGGTQRFGGEIARVVEQGYTRTESDVRCDVLAEGLEGVFGRYLYTGSFTDTAASTILTTIVTDLGIDTAHSITTGGVTTGPTIPFRQFENRRVDDIFDSIAAEVAFTWFLTPAKVLTFQRVTVATASTWDITDAPEVYTYTNLRVTRTRGEYYNQVLVVGGEGTGPEIEEDVKRDKDEAYYKLFHAVSSASVGEVDGSTVNLGERGVAQSSAQRLLWTRGDRIVEDKNPPGGAGDQTVTLTYEPALHIRAVVKDQDGIDTYGLRAATVRDTGITTYKDAFEVGDGFLAQHATFEAEEIMFNADTTTASGVLTPGTLMTNARSALGVTGDYLITQVTYTEVLFGHWAFVVRAEKGRPRETWGQTLRRLLGRAGDSDGADRTTLHYDRAQHDDATATMTISLTN